MIAINKAKGKIEKIERLVGTTTISILLSLLLFCVIDYGTTSIITAFNPGAEEYFPSEVYFAPSPYVMYKGTSDRDLQKQFGLNALGYRGAVPEIPKTRSEFRIFIIGGSTVLNGNPSTSELLQEYFHQAGRLDVKVYNFGVAASTLRMDIARFVFEASSYSPDLIIFYGGGNDIGMPYQADPRPNFPPNFLAYENNPLIVAGTQAQRWGTLFKLALFHSNIIRKYAGSEIKASLVPLEQVRIQSRWNSAEWSHAVAQAYLDNIKLAYQLTRAFNIKSIFVFQPILEFKSTHSSAEQQLHDPNLLPHATLCRSLITVGLRRMNEELRLPFADISDIFDSVKGDVFLDGIHINQKHYPDVAKAIFKATQTLDIP